jgi:cytochrome c biogenesis protein CcmG/thiol:disulfide interchange protein DsbE
MRIAWQRAGRAVALAGVAALLAVLVWNLTHQPSPPRIGGPAPAFQLGRLDGAGTLSLASLRGRAVVLNFWASWCEPCKAEAGTLERLWQQYRKRGVVFVGVDANDAAGDARRFMRAHGITYPVVHDVGGAVAADKYGVADLPVTYFVDRSGRLVKLTVLGPVSEKAHAEDFRRALRAAIES